MSIEELERTVSELPDDQLAEFRNWFDQFVSDRWDCEIEKDAAHGRLDAIANQALAEHEQGESSEL